MAEVEPMSYLGSSPHRALACDIKKDDLIMAGIQYFNFQSIGPLGPCFLDVNLSMCVSVCVSVHFLRYRLNALLPPLPEVGCLKNLEIRNIWGNYWEEVVS